MKCQYKRNQILGVLSNERKDADLRFIVKHLKNVQWQRRFNTQQILFKHVPSICQLHSLADLFYTHSLLLTKLCNL